jgi:hypothetical protein
VHDQILIVKELGEAPRLAEPLIQFTISISSEGVKTVCLPGIVRISGCFRWFCNVLFAIPYFETATRTETPFYASSIPRQSINLKKKLVKTPDL